MTPEAQAALGAQLAAADPSRSVWVSANAGTGKTRVLIDRISRLLLAGTPPGRVLCLTFTKAAAAEMANRLRERLGAWTLMADAALYDDLLKLLGREPDEAQTVRARRLFAQVLDAPGGLKIRTIHAFCESLLGQFPLEAGVAPHFQVIDERTSAELLAEARAATLIGAFAGRDPGLTDAVRHLAELADESGIDGVIRELAANRRRLRDLVAAHGSVAALGRAVRTVLGLAPGDSADSLVAAAAADGAFDAAALLRACRALDQGTAGDQERATAIRAWIENPATRAAGLTSAYAEVFLTKAGEPRAEKGLTTKDARTADPDTLPILLAEQQRICALAERLKAAATARATEALLTFADALLGTYDALKDGRALLDYDDLVLKVRGLLRAGGRAAWVHYKLDGGLDHILVDEAQDTSPEQWDVVAGLADEFFAGAGARATTRTLFAVGDEKQSIYSFQGADPAAFERMHQAFAERAREAGQPWRAVEMPLSFRSTWTVLRAVDAVFAASAAADGVTFHGRPIHHLSNRDGQAGLVEIWPTVKPEPVPETDPWDAPLDQLPALSPPVRLAERIAGRIAAWLKAGEMLASEGRPIKPGDVMILVRRRERFAEAMIRCLKERGIPVAGSDRMVLTEQLAVMDLMALGRFLLLPEDDLTLAEVLKGPLVGLDDDDLFALAWGRDGTLWEALRLRAGERETWQSAKDGLGRLLDRADFVPPFEFFSDVLGPGGGRRKILGRLGVDAGDPLDEFLALAQMYERDHVPSLQGFLHWLEAGRTEIKRDLEHGRGEVRVMTVHGAKGLQANVVFLPDTCTVPDPRLDARVLWHEADPPAALWPAFRANEEATCRALREAARMRQAQEYRRLFYVAMTRARDRLYVCGWETTRGRGEDCWYNRIEAALKERAEVVDVGFDEPGWRVSDPQTEAPDGRGEAAAEAADAGPPPAWVLRPPPPEADPPRPLTPSHPDGEEPPVVSPLGGDDGLRFRRGRLIHALLQTLPQLAPSVRLAAAEAFLARRAHGLDAAAQSAIAAETLAVLEHPEFGIIFGPAGRAEVPLVGTVGGRSISAQVDRLVVMPEAVLVVDFKTNRPAPSDPAAVPVIYLRQMAAYRQALGAIYPDRPVRCALLWTDGPRLMPLPDSLLDAHAP